MLPCGDRPFVLDREALFPPLTGMKIIPSPPRPWNADLPAGGAAAGFVARCKRRPGRPIEIAGESQDRERTVLPGVDACLERQHVKLHIRQRRSLDELL